MFAPNHKSRYVLWSEMLQLRRYHSVNVSTTKDVDGDHSLHLRTLLH